MLSKLSRGGRHEREKLLENEKFLLTSRKARDKIDVTASEAACTL